MWWIVYFDMRRPSRWLLRRSDPALQELVAIPSWFIANPLIYNRIFPGGTPSMPRETRIVGVLNDNVLLESSIIAFLIRDLNVLNEMSGAPDTEDKLSFFLTHKMPIIAHGFISQLRYITRQAEIPSHIGYGIASGPSKLPSINFPDPHPRSNVYINKYEFDTAITWQDFQALKTIEEAEKTSIHITLILDAIHALLEGDIRRTLLYSAIAMEAYAATEIGTQYDKIVDEGDPDGRFRLVSFSNPGNKQVTKDPIFTRLNERSRADFSLLLHEMPLYILGRSLLNENENLYSDARRLYRTRNRIAHRGEINAGDEGTFNLTFPDAHRGLIVALEVCSWFGMTEEFILPTPEHVEMFLPNDSKPVPLGSASAGGWSAAFYQAEDDTPPGDIEE